MLTAEKAEVIPPDNGWEEDSYYIVDVSYSSCNVIHRAIFYSGFLNNGNPAGYNSLFNPSYDQQDALSMKDVFYMKVITNLKMTLRRDF